MDTNITIQTKASAEGTAVLDKLFDIVELISQHPDGITPAEISEQLNLPRPTVYRLVAWLSRRGYLTAGEDRRLRIGLGFLRIGSRAPVASWIRDRGRPVLWSLANASGCAAAQIAVLDQGSATFLERTSLTNAVFKLDLRAGDTVPLYCTALGKAMLAQMTDAEAMALLAETELRTRTPATVIDPLKLQEEIQSVRRQGHAAAVAEYAEDVWSVAAPVPVPWTGTLYAIGVSEHMWRFSPDRLQAATRHVVAAAARLTGLLTNPENVDTQAG